MEKVDTSGMEMGAYQRASLHKKLTRNSLIVEQKANADLWCFIIYFRACL